MAIAARNQLRVLGVRTFECSVVNFPTALQAKFIHAWADFVSTDQCYELFNSHKDPEDGMLEVVTAFIAMLQSRGQRPFATTVPFAPAQISAVNSIAEMHALIRDSVERFISQRGIGQAFAKTAINIWPSYRYDKVISAHIPDYVDVYYSVVLRRTSGRMGDMAVALKSKTQHWFSKVSVPSKLLSPVDVAVLRNAKWPSVDDLTKMPSRWVEIVDGLSVARAEGNVLVFRTRIYPKTVVYMNSSKITGFFRLAAQRLSKK